MFSCASVRECDCIVVNFSRVGFSGEFYISLVSVGTMWVFSMLFLFEKILLFVIRRYCQQGLNSESLSKLRAILAAPAGTITNSLGRTRVGAIAFLLEPECMGPSVRSGDETRLSPRLTPSNHSWGISFRRIPWALTWMTKLGKWSDRCVYLICIVRLPPIGYRSLFGVVIVSLCEREYVVFIDYAFRCT